MAEKKFFVDINLQGNKLANAVVGANSSMTTAGSFQYNNGRLEYYNGTTVEEVANLSDISAVTGGLIFQGGYDASTNTPDIADGNALKGFFWAVTVAGTFLGEAVQVGDSIVAKIDEAGATLSDWLILQGNVVIATDEVDGIVRLATQTEANDGTEGGAVVITPATLQGKIDAQITPEISSKLPLAGGTMSGDINMGGNYIQNATGVTSEFVAIDVIYAHNNNNIQLGTNVTFDTNGNAITNVMDPTSGGDATNKTYVDGVGTTAEQNAKDYADSLAPNYDPAGSATTAEQNAKDYADSLAPNYDAAGSAAQALTDANAYTDTAISTEVTNRNNAIAAQSKKFNVSLNDWISENGSYYQIIDISSVEPSASACMTQVLGQFGVPVELYGYTQDAGEYRLETNITGDFTLLVTKITA